MIVGIDPGQSSGVACFIGGELHSLDTVQAYALPVVLSRCQGLRLVVMEDSRVQSHLFSAKGAKGASALKIARDVGRVDMVCAFVQHKCWELGVELICVSPMGKGAKLGSDDFKALTGWEGRTNQHERDAAMVAWPYRAAKIIINGYKLFDNLCQTKTF